MALIFVNKIYKPSPCSCLSHVDLDLSKDQPKNMRKPCDIDLFSNSRGLKMIATFVAAVNTGTPVMCYM